MASRLNPGIGEKTPEQRRAASAERFLGPFRKTRIIAKDSLGQDRYFDALVVTGATPKPIITIPFQINLSRKDGGHVWMVSRKLSSVVDGTNGDIIDLSTAGFDKETAITDTKLILLDADVDAETLEMTAWKLSAVAESADTDEVGLNDDGKQNKIRLLVGRVQFKDGRVTAFPAVTSAQRVSHGFLNGVLVRVFNDAPTHPDSLEDFELV